MPLDNLATASQLIGTANLSRIGNTPLIRLDRLTQHLPGVQILGKAEWLNPGGSVKRPRRQHDRLRRHKKRARSRQASVDRTRRFCSMPPAATRAIAYAMLGASLDFPVLLCMPNNVSVERKRILAAYGAEIVYTDPADGSDGAIRMARSLGSGGIPSATSTPTSTATTTTGAPLQRHRQRDLAADRRHRDSLHRVAWNQRDIHGHDAPPARVESCDQVHLHAA